MKKTGSYNIILTFFVVPLLAFLVCVLFLSVSYGNSLTFTKLRIALGGKKTLTVDASPQEKLQLIGCGISRSGSTSTDAALEKLGYRVYHGMDAYKYENHRDMWVKAYQDPDKYLKPIIEEILKLGYNATSPGSMPQGPLCIEISKMFPDAKVMINVRDNVESWSKSFIFIYSELAAIISHGGGFPLNMFLDEMYPIFNEVMNRWKVEYELIYTEYTLPWVTNYAKETIFHTEEDLKNAYLRFIDEVKEEIPDVLVFNVKDGWGPLLDHLDFDQSTTTRENLGEFPFLNSRRVYFILRYVIPILAVGYPFIILGILFLLLFALKKLVDLKNSLWMRKK